LIEMGRIGKSRQRTLPLSGKAALVTGAASGIGAAISARLAESGARVFAADLWKIDESQLVQGTERIGIDVRRKSDWQQLAGRLTDEGTQLDILVNNAGVNDRRGLRDSSLSSFRAIMAVNLEGPFLGMRMLRERLRVPGAAVINVASTAALSGHSFAVYATSKWALRGLSRSAALEFAKDGIRVNCICPGLISTPINQGQPYVDAMAKAVPLQRAGLPADVAELVHWLASDAASYVTGQDFVIDGGATAGVIVKAA
jgi:3alpha(or 20beta)-hydroxysteroid dehydrogenase